MTIDQVPALMLWARRCVIASDYQRLYHGTTAHPGLRTRASGVDWAMWCLSEDLETGRDWSYSAQSVHMEATQLARLLIGAR